MEFLGAIGSWCSGPGFFQGGGHGWQSFIPFHIGGIFQLLVIGLIIYFVARMVRKPVTDSGPTSPDHILKKRFAAGEIDKETYNRMRQDLRD